MFDVLKRFFGKKTSLYEKGLEYENAGDYEEAIKCYRTHGEQFYMDSSEKLHLVTCLDKLGKKQEALEALDNILHKNDPRIKECLKVGELLEKGYWGKPDYIRARQWYMKGAWYAPHNDGVPEARERIKSLMMEHDFGDKCCDCGKPLDGENIFFKSKLDQDCEYCESCLYIAHTVYVLDPLTGAMERMTFDFGAGLKMRYQEFKRL